MEYNKNKPLKIFTAFSGYDSQCLALERLKQMFPEFDYELVGWSDIDKNAIIAHNALFPDAADKNYGDICTIDWSQVQAFDLFTYSFPCTDISRAGQQKGLAKGSGTRSSLLWECERAIEIKKPKYLLMENVKDLVTQKYIKDFYTWMSNLEKLGYANFAQVLNSKDYGVAQNRERIFLVSIRIDDYNNIPRYYFPKKIKLTKKLKDYLEDNVDESYYLSDERLKELFEYPNGDVRISNHQWGIVNNKEKDSIGALCHTDYKEPPKILEQ